MFNYTGAALSHLWVGDGAITLVGPLVFVGLTAASWTLRPQPRRGFRPNPLTILGFTMVRIVGYWITTVVVATELAVGGIWMSFKPIRFALWLDSLATPPTF
jgi:hypothetical protein